MDTRTPLTLFGFSMASISATLTACPHQPPPAPLPERTAADVASGLDVAAAITDVVLASAAIDQTRPVCILRAALPAALRSAAQGVRAAADAPELPALTVDVQACGMPDSFLLGDDAAPWVELWSSMVQLVQLQVAGGQRPEGCTARVAAGAALAWLADGLAPAIAEELIPATANGVIAVDAAPLDWAACSQQAE